MVTLTRSEHPLNASELIVPKPSGASTEFSDELLNADLPIVVRIAGSVTVLRLAHEENADVSIDSTLSGMVIEDSEVQLSKALEEIAFIYPLFISTAESSSHP